tara:strand:+ start:25166 stop:25516 length:351 start_codon:yes stop_codon:yes gene_type:complete
VAKKTILLEAGTFLMREGEESSTMYLLIKGQLEVLKRKGDTEKPIGKINEGDLVGEMSFLDNSPRSASVRASENSEIFPIPRESFDETFLELPDWYKTLHRTIVDRLRKTTSRIKQ